MRPSLATGRISLDFWLNINFVVNYRGAFRSIVAIAIDLLTSEDMIFPLNHSGASATMVLTIPTTFGIAHARFYTCAERAAQSATQVGSSLLDSLTVPSTHYIPKIVFTFSPICRASTNSVTIYLIITRDFIFLCIGPHQQSAISSGWLVISSWWRQAAERTRPHDCAMTWAFHIPHAPCSIITIYFHIWT